MALTGRVHPLLVHFPIALVLIAAVAELVSLTTQFPEWHMVAVANIRAGAAFAVASAGAGWILASSRIVEASPALEWHRWLGLAWAQSPRSRPRAGDRRDGPTAEAAVAVIASRLFSAAGLVAVAGHFGAVLVWGADFLRP